MVANSKSINPSNKNNNLLSNHNNNISATNNGFLTDRTHYSEKVARK